MSAIYTLKPDGFYIENFNAAKPFSSFLPGIAGELGKPLWVFYANRGQCIASFGIRNKNGAMLEFYPANKAYTQTPLLGFRTFIRLGKGSSAQVYEPFQIAPAAKITQRLRIRPEEIEIEETNAALGLRTRVAFFTLPNETLPALVRQVTLENIGRRPFEGEMLDGLPQIVPYGLIEILLKQMSRTMEAFAEVRHGSEHLPFFKLKIEPSDKPDVEWINGGFFAFSLRDGKSLPIRTDPETVFGSDTSFQKPLTFAAKGLAKTVARTQSMTASAFAETRFSLKPGQSAALDSFYGQAEPWEAARALRARILRQPGYATTKRAENSRLIAQLTDGLALHAGPPELDPYTRQAFLDNTLRGGQPVIMGGASPKIFHTFTRKHGDMERDYNAFEVAPTYYSQGNGNFRDVNQNRRSENYLFGGVGAANIETFFNLIQLDGNNPLVIQYEKFYVPEERLGGLLSEWAEGRTPAWETFLSKPFNPGQLLEELTAVWGSAAKAAPWLEKIIGLSEKVQDAVHGEGYWVDHWIYNLDLLESFAAIHPDGLAALLFERRDFTYFDSEYVVQPRDKKYLRRPDGAIRQLHAVVKDAEKARLIAGRVLAPHMMRTQRGAGPVYRTTLAAKILNLLAVKISTLDPFGAGLEMEAEKPGWCDAMNGLPGLLGSSTHEAFALRRWITFLKIQIESSAAHGIAVPAEVGALIGQVAETLAGRRAEQFFPTWDRLATLREAFREQVRLGISGGESTLSRADVLNFLARAKEALEESARQALKPGALCVSYFINEVTDYEELPLEAAKVGASSTERPVQHVRAKAFRQVPVSPFLEASVQALRAAATPAEAAAVYRSVRRSLLYDAKLGMYRLNVPLTKESYEIGRSKIFAPGWLENESIFLHMHYKFLLETLRSGLAKEFFGDLKRALVAFQKPAVYGRSPLENSSFIASSRFADTAVHGTGFVARLSGATAEWISMVFYMGLGDAPFQMSGGELRFTPRPVLADWFFAVKPDAEFEKNTFGFKLFGKTWIVYKNPRRKSTFGPGAVAPAGFDLQYRDGRVVHYEGNFLPAAAARDLRDLQLERVTILLS